MKAYRRSAGLAVGAFTLSLPAACSHDVSSPMVTIDPPSTISVAFCAPPTWVAFQDGDGAWTRADPMSLAPFVVFHHTFGAKRGGIAVAREFSGGLTSLAVVYGTPDELVLPSDTAGTSCGLTSFRSVLGTVAPLQSNEFVLLNAGRGSLGFVTASTGPDFEIGGLSDNPHEIVATKTLRANETTTLSAIILRRIPSLPDKTALPAFDFDSAEAFRPVTHTVTLNGMGAGGVTAFTVVRTAHGENTLAFSPATSTGATIPYFALPDGHLEAGELQSLNLSASAGGNVARGATVYFASATDRTVTFGALPGAPDFSVIASTPTLRMRARFDSQADYDQLTSISYQQGQNTLVSVAMTSAYALLGGGYDLSVPDFTSVDRFDTHWALHATGQLLWTSSHIGGTLGLGFGAVPKDGATRRAASDGGVITP